MLLAGEADEGEDHVDDRAADADEGMDEDAAEGDGAPEAGMAEGAQGGPQGIAGAADVQEDASGMPFFLQCKARACKCCWR